MFGLVAAAVGGSVVSGLLGADASKKAAQIQGDATRYSADVQKEMYDTTRGDLAPYREAGVPALQRLMHLTGVGAPQEGEGGYGSLMQDFTLADFAKDPGYAFRQEEGEKALGRGAAARGLLKSTPGLKSLMRFNQDLASTEYGAAYGRFEASKGSKFNLLSYLSGTGQNAAAQTGTAGTNAATGISSSAIAGGNAAAGGVLGTASSWNNAIQGGLGNFMYQQRWDQMMSRFPVFSSASAGTPAITAPAGMGG